MFRWIIRVTKKKLIQEREENKLQAHCKNNFLKVQIVE